MIVVCGTDFGESARAGASAAAAVARRLDAELVLAHVEAEGRAEAGSTRASLEVEVRRLEGEQPGLRATPALVPGRSQEALVALAEERSATLLVVGSGGHWESSLFRVGGWSERLSVSARVPLLVVRTAAPFVRWAAGGGALRVLLGVDASPATDAAIAFVATLRKAGACDVVAAHLYDVPTERIRYGVRRPISWVDRDPELEALLARDLAKRVGELPGTGEVSMRPHLGFGRLADHLLDLAEREKVDLVVVGTHGAGGLARLGSISSGVLHFGRMAIACIPASARAGAAPAGIPELRRVLVATDLSPFANAAVRYGYALVAEREGAELFLLHVVEGTSMSEEAERELAARLRELAPSAGAALQVSTRTEVVADPDVATAICAAAERLGVDALCVASHGQGGLRREVLGSVADAVVRRGRRPVLVVRPPAG